VELGRFVRSWVFHYEQSWLVVNSEAWTQLIVDLYLEENEVLFELDGQSGVQKRRLDSFREKNDDSLSNIFAHFLLVISMSQSLD
jgi:hypothetical protein